MTHSTFLPWLPLKNVMVKSNFMSGIWNGSKFSFSQTKGVFPKERIENFNKNYLENTILMIRVLCLQFYIFILTFTEVYSEPCETSKISLTLYGIKNCTNKLLSTKTFHIIFAPRLNDTHIYA